MKKLVFISLLVFSLFTACHNQDWEFDDYDYTTVYFPYQSPVRTLILGEYIYDNSLDNAHKCKIMATMGGVYTNATNRILDITVDNSLCDDVLFEESGEAVLPMPDGYYSLGDNQITILSGSKNGGVEVQLTDAFFADPLSIENTYVIPLRISSFANADSILKGRSNLANPNPVDEGDWDVVPKDYVLYCVKYINPWDANYLRRGVTEVKGNNGNLSLDTTMVYHEEYVEKDQVVSMETVSMSEVSLALTTKNRSSVNNIPFELRLKFDDSGKCTVSSPESTSYSIMGSGELVNDGDMWGNEKRDVVYLDYQIDFGSTTHSFTDTLVFRDRGVAFETFNPVIQE